MVVGLRKIVAPMISGHGRRGHKQNRLTDTQWLPEAGGVLGRPTSGKVKVSGKRPTFFRHARVDALAIVRKPFTETYRNQVLH